MAGNLPCYGMINNQMMKGIIAIHQLVCYDLLWSNRVYKVWKASLTRLKRREVVRMGMYEVLSLLFLGGTFLIALLAYIDRNNKRK